MVIFSIAKFWHHQRVPTMAVPRTHRLGLWSWPRRGAAVEFRGPRRGTSGFEGVDGVDGGGRSWPCVCELIHGQQDLPGHLAGEVDVAHHGDLWWKTWALGLCHKVILEESWGHVRRVFFACAKDVLATHCAQVVVFLMFSHIGFGPECMSAMILIFWCDFCRIDLTFQLAVPWGWCDFCPSDVT